MMKQKIQITKITTREFIKENRKEIETERSICNKKDLVEEMKAKIPTNYDKAAIQFLYSRQMPIFFERKNNRYVNRKGMELCQCLDKIGNTELLLKRIFFFIENEVEQTRTIFYFEPIDLTFIKERPEEPFKVEVYAREDDSLFQENTYRTLKSLEENLNEIDNDVYYILLNGHLLETANTDYEMQLKEVNSDKRVIYHLHETMNKKKNKYVINLGEYNKEENETYFYQSYYAEKSKIL